MTRPKAVRTRGSRPASTLRPLLVTLLLVVAPIAALAAFLLLRAPAPAPLASLGTADAHALAFDPRNADHIFFGHHGGLLESRDGGRTWMETTLSGADAMNVSTGADGGLQVAGHELYVVSSDGGATWQPVETDLPGLDLHAFAVDPADRDHAWTFAAGLGLFETTDGGSHWELRQEGNWAALTAYRTAETTVLVAVGSEGLASSSNGGETWRPLAYPGAPLSGGLAAAADGSAIYAATVSGIRRSDDGGATWQATGWDGAALAMAVARSNPSLLALVDDEMNFYRSTDGGASWPGP
jgi:photosystem II stability/assembly factor-like uncharacterized protein